MNQPKINRRDWLRAGSLIAGGFAFGSLPAISNPSQRLAPLHFKPEFGEPLQERPKLKARLLANENPFGPSPKAKEVLHECIDNSFRYPFWEIRDFKNMIAEAEGVQPENVMLGAGSSEILLAAAALYGMGKSKILSSDITYWDLLKSAEEHGAKIDLVPVKEDLDIDLEAVREKMSRKHSLVYLVNPNNPTGKSIDPAKLREFCMEASSTVPVFVDEAYIDFQDDIEKHTMISCVRKGKNVIVARTFSKLHGFAGLRVGYAIALPETIEKLEKFTTGGRNISYPSMYAAMASYQDSEFLAYSKSEILKSKKFLYDLLEKNGYSYIKSDTNFVLFPLKYMTAERFADEMLKQQVGVRHWSFQETEWCRVSMGTMEEMNLFAKAFEKLS